jgi:peroxiredoxin
MKFRPLLLLALLLLGITTAFRPTAESGYKVGDSAMDFKLKNVDGQLVSLADNKAAKGYIVVFTCNHCPFSQAYEQRIIDLHRTYAPKGYPVVAINPNDPAAVPEDSFAEMQKRAKEKGYPFSYLLDETQTVARTYGATRTPHVYIVNRAGAGFKVAYIGAIDNNTEDPKAATEKYVDAAMTQILAGKPATTSFTKAVGCGIKWKKA